MDEHTEKVSCPEGAIPVVYGLSRFRNCEELSDYTVKCGQAKWPVHRMVLTLHSTVLARACLGNFKESRQGFIDLSDDQPECVEALIYYLYNFEYYTRVDDPDVEPKFHIAMALIADKYDIPALKKQAIEKCNHSLHGNCHPDMFADTTAAAYESALAVRDLCDYIIDFAIDHKDVGIGQTIRSRFAKVMRYYPDLWTDITKRLAACLASATPTARPGSVANYHCPQCYKNTGLSIGDRTTKYRCKHCKVEFYGSYWMLTAKKMS